MMYAGPRLCASLDLLLVALGATLLGLHTLPQTVKPEQRGQETPPLSKAITSTASCLLVHLVVAAEKQSSI